MNSSLSMKKCGLDLRQSWFTASSPDSRFCRLNPERLSPFQHLYCRQRFICSLKKKARREDAGAAYSRRIHSCLYWADWQMRNDPVMASKRFFFHHRLAINIQRKSRRGGLQATTYGQSDTRALNARKALRAAPISMGRGEIPVELCQQPSDLQSKIFLKRSCLLLSYANKQTCILFTCIW